MEIKSACVFCSSASTSTDLFAPLARELGKCLVERGITLVYGGANVGLMGELASAVISRKGHVVGVLPGLIHDMGVTESRVTELIITKDMHERKSKMEALSDAFIVLPGGIGTLEEFFEVLVLKQLGVHYKPIIILEPGFHSLLLKYISGLIEAGLVHPGCKEWFHVSRGVKELFEYLDDYNPPTIPRKVRPR